MKTVNARRFLSGGSDDRADRPVNTCALRLATNPYLPLWCVMIEVHRHFPCGPEQVFNVLADGWLYANWVVGAAHICRVDDRWPAVGARICYQMGPWPTQARDFTTVLAVEHNRLLELRAQLRPLGAAKIRLELTRTDDGTRVRLIERVHSGAFSLIPDWVQAVIVAPRNAVSLARLEDIAVGRHAAPAVARPVTQRLASH